MGEIIVKPIHNIHKQYRQVNLVNSYIFTPPINIWDGLVSFYKLDEITGTTAYDSYGAAHLTNTSVSINQSGKLGQAYASTASNQNLNATGLTPITSTFTVNAWCYRTANGLGAHNVIAENGDYANGFGIWINASGHVGGFINSGYGNYTLDAIPLNTWTMVTVTYDSVNALTYVNGVLKVTFPLSNFTNTATTRRMFNRALYGAEQYIGRIDNVSFFNKALTQARIIAHYNLGDGLTL
jgi:hypothetical protein